MYFHICAEHTRGKGCSSTLDEVLMPEASLPFAFISSGPAVTARTVEWHRPPAEWSLRDIGPPFLNNSTALDQVRRAGEHRGKLCVREQCTIENAHFAMR